MEIFVIFHILHLLFLVKIRPLWDGNKDQFDNYDEFTKLKSDHCGMEI